jgi:hypothetical protein
MRYGIALTAALIIVPTTDIRSQQWCGYFGRPDSLIQCGYSTLDACKIAIGTHVRRMFLRSKGQKPCKFFQFCGASRGLVSSKE